MSNREGGGCFPGVNYNKLSKEELLDQIKLAKKGDEAAFELVLSHMYNYLMHLATEFFIQGSDNEDVYQEGAIKLINVIDKYDESKGSFMGFAQSSIRKHIITVMNREMAQKRSILNTSYSLDDTTENDEGDKLSYIDTVSTEDSVIQTNMGDPLEIVRKDYEEYLIEEISKNLSDRERKVFVLRVIDGLSYKDVAKHLNLYKINKNGVRRLNQKSVDNAIWRSRPKIKKTLEKLQIKQRVYQEEIEIIKKKRARKKK